MLKSGANISQREGDTISQHQGQSRIGRTIHFVGEISGQEDLTVEGQIKGKINLSQNNVTINETAKVTAEITAKTIFIKGRIEGNVSALEKVVISSQGSMTGDITAPRISIEDGAQFKGSVKMDPKKPMGHQPHLPEHK